MTDRVVDRSRGASLRIERVLAWFFASVGGLLVVLISAYWLWVLEPTLKMEAESRFRLLSAAQAHSLEQALATALPARLHQDLEGALDAILLLKDPITGEALTRRIELIMDASQLDEAVGELDLTRGDPDCADCLVTKVPLYRLGDRQIVGIATFHCAPKLLGTLLESFRERILWAGGGILCLFALAWATASRLMGRLGDSEANLRSLFEAAAVPMVLLEERCGGLTHANKAALSYLGLVQDSSGLYSSEAWRALLATGLPMQQQERQETRIQIAGTAAHWALLSVTPLRFHGGAAVLVSLADISALKTIQDELEIAAVTDPLTGLYSRRYLFKAQDAEVARVRRYGGRLSAILFDLDRFKGINDTFGHRMGDVVLMEAANAIRSAVREVDVAGRYGGEELLVILPDASVAEARAVAERIRLAIGALRWSSYPRLRVTVSAGVAELTPNMTADALIDLADSRLYEAKTAGRDRVVG